MVIIHANEVYGFRQIKLPYRLVALCIPKKKMSPNIIKKKPMFIKDTVEPSL